MSVLRLVLVVGLAGCVGKRVTALEVEVAALRAQQEAQAAEIAELETSLAVVRAAADIPVPDTVVPLDAFEGASSAVLVTGVVNEADRAALKDGGFTGLVTQLRVIPHRNADGVLDGVRVSAIRPESIAARAGLYNGDVVRGIRGATEGPWMQIVDLPTMEAAYEAMRKSETGQIVLERRGQLTLLQLLPG